MRPKVIVDTVCTCTYSFHVRPELCTTTEAARKIGITRAGLYKWIGAGKIKAPVPVRPGDPLVRFWTLAQIRDVIAYKRTLAPGHGGRPFKSEARKSRKK